MTGHKARLLPKSESVQPHTLKTFKGWLIHLVQVSQRGCPIPGNIQGQIEQGSEPDLVEDVPCSLQGVGLGGL